MSLMQLAMAITDSALQILAVLHVKGVSHWIGGRRHVALACSAAMRQGHTA